MLRVHELIQMFDETIDVICVESNYTNYTERFERESLDGFDIPSSIAGSWVINFKAECEGMITIRIRERDL